MSITGGNWQIFDNMVRSSATTLRLDTRVTSIERLQDNYGSFKVQSETKAFGDTSIQSRDVEEFDAVVLAGPYQFSHIEIHPMPTNAPESLDYVRLHVTLFTSPHSLDPGAFNLKPTDVVPDVILTTLQPDEDLGDDPNAVGSPGFLSISTLRSVTSPKAGGEEYLYKIFSREPVNGTFLANILGVDVEQLGSLCGTCLLDIP